MAFYQTKNRRNFKLHYGQPPNGLPEDTLVHNWSFNSVSTNDLYVDNCNIHLGSNAGATRQATGCIAIGCFAGQIDQGHSSSDDDIGHSIAIGTSAGENRQYGMSISIGFQAGQSNQGNGYAGDSDDGFCIAIGYRSGQSNQGGSSGNSISLGTNAGSINQHGNAIAIGALSGNSNQSWDAIALGHFAGQDNQGSYAIALGRGAGTNSQASNSIVINANGGTLDTSSSGLYIAPVRANVGGGFPVYYNPSTAEFYYVNV